MRVKLRLQRFGRKKLPFYRIVVASSSTQRDGKFLDIVGLYHPMSAESEQIKLKADKINYWLDKGAIPTDTVKDILSKQGLWKDFADAKKNRRVQKRKRINQNRKAKKQRETVSTS